MANKVTVEFPQDEFSALLELALQELRNVDDQVRFFVREGLIRRGLLKAPVWPPTSPPPPPT